MIKNAFFQILLKKIKLSSYIQIFILFHKVNVINILQYFGFETITYLIYNSFNFITMTSRNYKFQDERGFNSTRNQNNDFPYSSKIDQGSKPIGNWKLRNSNFD